MPAITTTVEKALITTDGEMLQMRFSYPAPTIVVQDATTISFTDNNDDDTMRIQDSANGFGALADKVGQQIAITGATNSANNFYWEIRSYTDAGDITVGIRNNTAQASMTQDRDGVTEAAGASVTISLVEIETNVTSHGTITVGGDVSTVADVIAAPTRQVDHTVYVNLTAELRTPLLWGQSATVSGTAGGVWVYGHGGQNSAFSDYEVFSTSSRMVADTEYGYDNCQFTSVGIGDAPAGITGAADPTTNANLVSLWAADLQGALDGSSVGSTVPLEDQVGSNDITCTVGWDYVATDDAFDNGFAGWKNFNHPTQNWRLQLKPVGSPDWDSGTGHTVIMVAKCTGTANSGTGTISYDQRTVGVGADINGGSASFCRPSSASRRGTQVLTGRCQADGTGHTWINYSKINNSRLAGKDVGFGHMGVNYIEAVMGRIYYFDTALTDEEIESYTRFLLNLYEADWAPSFWIKSDGNDSNLGHATSALATVDEAIQRCAFDSRPHLLFEEGDDLDFSAITSTIFTPQSSNEGGNKDQRKADSTQDPMYPCVLRTVRTSAREPVATLRMNPLADFTVTGSLAPLQNAFIYGLSLRVGEKIPTNSILRNGSDDPVNTTGTAQPYYYRNTTTSEAFYEGTLADGQSYGDQTSVQFVNCHGVGVGIQNVQEDRLTGIATSTQFINCSSSHAWGSGHTLPHFVQTMGMYYYNGLIFPSPGHEPTDSLEPADIFSRGIYDQYDGGGSHVIKNYMVVDDASSPIQFRNGGVLIRSSIVDSPSGWSATLLDSAFIDCIQDGSFTSSAAQDINWGAIAANNASMRFERCLFLPENEGGTVGNAECFKIINDASSQDENATVGSGPANQWAPIGSTWQTTLIKDCTVANRYAYPIRAELAENITVEGCLFQTPNYMIDVNFDDTELASAGYAFTDNVFDSTGTESFATTDSGDRTLSEFEGLITTASGNVEAGIEFQYNTRSFKSYAGKKLVGITDATSLDLALEMVRRKVEMDAYDEEYTYDYIFDWIRNGYYSTSHAGRGAVKTLVDLGGGSSQPPITGGGTGPWGVRASVTDIPKFVEKVRAHSVVLTNRGWEQRLAGTDPDKGLTEVIVAGRFAQEASGNQAPYFFEGVNSLDRTLEGISGAAIKPYIIEIVDPDKVLKGDSVMVGSSDGIPQGLEVIKMSLKSPLEIFAITGTPEVAGSDQLEIVFTDGEDEITAMISYKIEG